MADDEQTTAAEVGGAEYAEAHQWGTPEGRHMIALLWDPPAARSRGPRPRLTLDGVLATAMTVAARDGADGLSMRRVAAELGVGTMSLYTYVPGRDELFELMIDRAWGERRRVSAGPWRAQVEECAEQAWQMYQRHPWLVHANLARLPLGPHVLDAQEELYRGVAQTGLPAPDQVQISGAVEAHVFGAARAAIVDTRQASATGVSTDTYWESRSSFWGTHYSAERFPNMTAIWEAGAFDLEVDSHQDMRFGLAMILDGVERRVAERPPGGS